MSKKLFLIVLLVGILFSVIAGGKFIVMNFDGILPLLLSQKDTLTKSPDTGLPISLPEGFSISVFADNFDSPRDLHQGPGGTLLVSDRGAGNVVALFDRDSDGVAEEKKIVISNLDRPHGLALDCRRVCTLLVAETKHILAYDYDTKDDTVSNKRVFHNLPDGGRHTTRSMTFGAGEFTDTLFVSVGSTCDTCQEEDPRHGTVLAIELSWDQDGRIQAGKERIFADGLRNAVFIALHPVTGELWGTEMGRDFLGDDLPPDEVNVIREGGWYGWPWFYGDNVFDGTFRPGVTPGFAKESVGSHVDIPAHSAPLGLAFAPEGPPATSWPEEYWHDLFVAYHGSWNRSEPTGYKIVRIQLDENGNYRGIRDFATGWLTQGGTVLGRPVDILALPGGVMYVSDDHAGLIYRITRDGGILGNEPVSDAVRLETPQEGDRVSSPLAIAGEARGPWFFEASFSARLEDADGTVLGYAILQAQDEWMTVDFVPFEGTLEFSPPVGKTGTLILERANPSGLPEYAGERRLGVIFK